MSKEGREVGRGVRTEKKTEEKGRTKRKKTQKGWLERYRARKGEQRREGKDGAGPEVGWQGRGKEEKGGEQEVDLGMVISLPEKYSYHCTEL